ncbi:hypothetical protein B5S28_g3218 [[Candida] boidinii]|nr:hypothetical protein B5S28_g3218 [[Candida] boidinii]
MAKPTAAGRFAVISIGLLTGFSYGLYILKDYQIIKYDPPSPENFDKDGNWKEKTWFRLRFTDRVQPLELKPEAKQRVLEEREAKEHQTPSSNNNSDSN